MSAVLQLVEKKCRRSNLPSHLGILNPPTYDGAPESCKKLKWSQVYFCFFRNTYYLGIFIFSDQTCCWLVRLWYTTKTHAWNLHKSKFGYYKMEPGLVNGHAHYTSIFANGMYLPYSKSKRVI